MVGSHLLYRPHFVRGRLHEVDPFTAFPCSATGHLLNLCSSPGPIHNGEQPIEPTVSGEHWFWFTVGLCRGTVIRGGCMQSLLLAADCQEIVTLTPPKTTNCCFYVFVCQQIRQTRYSMLIGEL